MLRNHSGAIFGMLIGLAAAFGVTLIPGCVKTLSLTKPGVKVTAPELQREVVTIQQGLDDEAATIQQTIQAHREADTKLVSDYNAKIKASNASISLASNDLISQEQRLQSGISLLGGIASAAAKGTLDPLSLIGSAFTLLTIGGAAGSLTDSAKKTAVISNLRNQNGAGSGTAPEPAPQDNGIDNSGGNVPAPIPFVVANPALQGLQKAA